jgi:hypothetical protein
MPRDSRIVTEIDPVKDDAAVHGRRTQRQANLLAGMQTDPRGADGVSECALLNQDRKPKPVNRVIIAR